MCGIAGFITEGPADEARLRNMCDALRHRGPDGDGYHTEDSVALGMRRLAIIDLQTGEQPISNEDGSIVIVYNGESYNFPELRRQLQSKGHAFKTATDTECVVHLYEEYGTRCVEHLRGMFAFALWDRGRRRLLLARDRVGKKPLYYRVDGKRLSFASELKALLRGPAFPRSVDLEAMHHYLTYQYVPAPWSILEGVKKLPPGHVLTFEDGRATVARYWQLSYQPKLSLDEREATDRLWELLLEATSMRLLSDRPVGAFLSGGIDSSLVVAAMAQSTSELRTFSIGFDDSAYDEREHARVVAQRFGTDHHELVVRPSALEMLPRLAWHYDEPFADASAIPSMYLAQMTREHVTVALNGDGGDESFGGYDRYLANLAIERLHLSERMQALARRIAQRLPAGEQHSRARRVRRVFDGLGSPSEERYISWLTHFDNAAKEALYCSSLRERLAGLDSYDIVRGVYASSDAEDLVDRTMAVDVETYLPGDLLTKMDIATMAHSVEARSPFLDHELMQFAASLPSNLKIRGRERKYLLKRLASRWLPPDIVRRPKRGFGVPLQAWLRGELRDFARDHLTDGTARGRGYFQPAQVSKLLDEHDHGIDNSTRIWNLLQLELWHRNFIDS